MVDEAQRAGTPDSLAGADPFAAPRIMGASVRHSQTTPLPGTSETAELVPCPCSCMCGNDTGKTYTEVESISAARFLRCEPCGKALHFGPTWAKAESVVPTRIGDGDHVAVGSRTGQSFVIREHSVDPRDAADDREIAEKLAQDRRDAARTRWLENLPERWQLPYNEGEELVPEVEERLARLRSGRSGDHGTSLLCFGPLGSGKTWVAYTYARAAVDRHLLWPQEIVIGTEAEIVEPIASASPWQVDEKTKALLKPSLKMLVIDDVGAFSSYSKAETRWAAFGKIIDWMYAHKRAVVITTNLTLGDGGELERWVGTRPYERLKSMAGKDQVYRDENKRGEMTALWESEYQQMKSKSSGID